MTLKTRVIPILQWDGVQAVKTTQFARPPRNVGSMMQHIQNMNRREVDELIILDINATLEKRGPLFEKIKEFTSECYMPVTIGGGVSNLSHIEQLLKAGADKVGIRTSLFDGHWLNGAISKFGSQAIVGIFDVQHGIFNRKWSGTDQYCLIQDGVDILNEWGVGEILITGMNNEGMRLGYDLATLRDVNFSKVPIIINGGCGTPAHMLEAIQAGAHAVAASSMFLFTDTTPKDCARYLAENGVPTRD